MSLSSGLEIILVDWLILVFTWKRLKKYSSIKLLMKLDALLQNL